MMFLKVLQTSALPALGIITERLIKKGFELIKLPA